MVRSEQERGRPRPRDYQTNSRPRNSRSRHSGETLFAPVSAVLIRKPRGDDAAAFLAAVRRSRSLHRGWVAPPATLKAYRVYLKRIHSGQDHCGFLIIRSATKALV